MARARLIKPAFFKNEELAELPFETRLLFAGLWTLADREGRLECRPKRIKAEVFPYDSVDIEEMLDALRSRGFLVIYQVDNEACIAIPTWHKHQTPHVKEQASTIPAPDLHGASMVQVSDKHKSCPSLTLNPLPLTLNPVPPAEAGSVTTKPRRKRTAHEYTERFEAWWDLYPKKIDKYETLLEWEKLSEAEQSLADSGIKDQLPKLLAKIAKDGSDEYLMKPKNWIANKRWQLTTSTPSLFQPTPPTLDPTAWFQQMMTPPDGVKA
jgi:hypothetical protein